MSIRKGFIGQKGAYHLTYTDTDQEVFIITKKESVFPSREKNIVQFTRREPTKIELNGILWVQNLKFHSN